jgi:epoxyqueuosine reductase
MEEIDLTENSILIKLEGKSKSLGILDIKIAEYKILEDDIKNYQNWISNNHNATMSWMERNIDKRKDISLILPDVKSVIVVAYNYFKGNIHPEKLNSDEGKISKYAWGSDYHDILLPKLKELEIYLKELFPDCISKSYVDTGPLLEKKWAELSGLGWQGKNSLIINKNYGSYFFLGIILTNIKLPATKMVKDYCGSCRKCIDACPTSAIIQDKVIDSNKCLSYWTIEAKPDVVIPEHIAKNAKSWIYGCDICQEVCPWNRHKPLISAEELFNPRFDGGILKKEIITEMVQEEFSGKFKNSPIKRLKIAGLKRNFRDIL